MEAGNEVRVDPEISFNKVTLILTLAGLFLLLYYSDNFEIEPGSRSVIMLSNAQNPFFFSLYIADTMENYPSLL